MSNTQTEKIIFLTKGIGTGPTSLSAFDAALHAAGIGNYNLIHLSSVIPSNHTVEIKQLDPTSGDEEYGNKLYLVYASNETSQQGTHVYAGLGWVTTKEDPKRGLFVEHIGESEESVKDQITASLDHMVSYRSEEYNDPKWFIEGTMCEKMPVCVVTAAIYASENWNTI